MSLASEICDKESRLPDFCEDFIIDFISVLHFVYSDWLVAMPQ